MDRRVRVSPSSNVLRGDDEGRRDEMTVFMQSGLNCRKHIFSTFRWSWIRVCLKSVNKMNFHPDNSA